MKKRAPCTKTMRQVPFLLLVTTILLSVSVSVRAEEEVYEDLPYYDRGFGYACANVKCDPGMFCAADGVCHEINCENFYEYAPSVYTGRVPRRGSQNTPNQDNDGEETTEVGELECYINEFPDAVDPPCAYNERGLLFPVAVHYSCRDYYSSHKSYSDFQCDAWDDFFGSEDGSGDMKRRFATANRVCTAKPNPEQRFICYDIAPDTNLTSYFDDYLEAVESFGECDANAPTDEGNITWVSNGHQIANSIMGVIPSGGIGAIKAGANIVSELLSPYEEGNLGENFDPFLVAASSISTVLMSDISTTPPPSTPFPSTEAASSSPAQTFWSLSRVLVMISMTMIFDGDLQWH